MIAASPEVIFLATKPLSDDEPNTYIDCTYTWPERNTQIYQLFVVLLLYITPFVLMTISYSQIVGVLWRNKTVQVGGASFSSCSSAPTRQVPEPTSKSQPSNNNKTPNNSSCGPSNNKSGALSNVQKLVCQKLSIAAQSPESATRLQQTPTTNALIARHSNIQCAISAKMHNSIECPNATSLHQNVVTSACVVYSAANVNATASSNEQRFCKLIESRKKAAKMLIVIMVMFGLCYLPVHVINLLR